MGKVTIKYVDKDGELKTKKIKCRKNLVLDIIEPEKLYEECLSYCKQENVALVKSEFAKIRIAVASPIQHYLPYAYLMDQTGIYYENWEGNTLDESPDKSMERQFMVWVKLKQGYFSLPFDFANFDHQPKLDEVYHLDRILYRLALDRCASKL